MNVFKMFLLLATLSLLLIGVGYLIAGPVGASIAFFMAIIMNMTSFWFSDRIVIGMFRARPASPTQYPGLHRMVDNLSGAALVPKPKLWILPLKVPNAFAVGKSPRHASVAVTEAILHTLNEGELEGVLGHEMAHIKNRDTLIAAVAATLAGAVVMIAYWARWIAIAGTGDRGRGGIGVVGLLLLFILAPLAALIIQMAISRTEEYRADRRGAYLSGKPLDLASALEKLHLAARRRPLGGALPSSSHLFIINPFGTGFPFEMFSTHPPTEERVKILRALAEML